MVELKYITGYAVSLRPHQVSWLSKHSNSSSWILVKQQKKSEDKSKLFLFHARDAIQLKMEGLRAVEPEYSCEQAFDWTKVFEKIFD